MTTDQGCKKPPLGWWCSRKPGHAGPCAARRRPKKMVLTRCPWGSPLEQCDPPNKYCAVCNS